MNSLVFANSEGTNTMRIFSHPVKYVAEDGTVRDISLDITAKAEGGFVSADHEVVTTFRNKLTDGISLEYNDIDIRLKLELAAGVEPMALLGSDSKTVTYNANANTSYVYELTYTGFKEDIVVKRYTGQTEYHFTLYTHGLSLQKEDDMYFLTDSAGSIQATIGSIIVFTADERNNTMGSMTHKVVRPDQEYLLTIHLDADYLADEKTRYPIRIDPTIEINNSSGTGAIEDVTVNEIRTFNGLGEALYIGRASSGYISRGLMRFPNLKIDVLSTNITAASIEIWDLMCQDDEEIVIECYTYNEFAPDWSENTTTTWENLYDYYLGDRLDSHAVMYGQGNAGSHRYSFSILPLAKDWAAGIQDPAHGVVFKASDAFEDQTGSSVQMWYKTFASYNRSAYKPSLSITYNTIRVNVGKTKDISSAAAGISGATWSSSNTAVATVSNGIVTGVSSGTATISATNGTSTVSCTVQVRGNGGSSYVQGSMLPYSSEVSITAGYARTVILHPNESGYYTLYTFAANTNPLTDTTLALYSDNTLQNAVAWDDDGGDGSYSSISAHLSAGTTYYLVISGYSLTSSGNVSYKIRKGLPTSGYEMEYNPALWNDLNALVNSNCYSYALDCNGCVLSPGGYAGARR